MDGCRLNKPGGLSRLPRYIKDKAIHDKEKKKFLLEL